MTILELENINKLFANVHALKDVSIKIPEGCVFGLLGPNGAGKTTLIRIITRILGPDSGKILFRNQEFLPAHVKQMGYMPEERGLYKKMKVGEHLLYLVSLRGLPGKVARAQTKKWMQHFEIEGWWNRKIEDLSKGMQQKVQFIATIAHEPDLLILDEPFSGLDPINTDLFKTEIKNMAEQGKTIIFSTHRMEQVEEVCENLALINDGSLVLDGNVNAIKDSFKDNNFEIGYETGSENSLISTSEKTDSTRFEHGGFEIISQSSQKIRVALKPGFTSNDLLQEIMQKGIQVTSFNEILPTINEIFIRLVNKENGGSEDNKMGANSPEKSGTDHTPKGSSKIELRA